MRKDTMRYLVIVFLFFATNTHADPVRLYQIFTATKFVPKPSESIPQCKEFATISNSGFAKLIDFGNTDQFDCIALKKDDETCGLAITLKARNIPQINPFGNCHLSVRVHKVTQRIDRVVINLD